MKTSLTAVSLLLAAGIPGTIIAEFIGLRLPTALDPGCVFSAFVVAATLFTAFGDYSHPASLLPIQTHPTLRVAPLARITPESNPIRLAA